ncbi:Olfactory receptor 52K1 [Nibea albiflora]|uniref:Olfactory receptor 52K1 n=1 Tax=Nibea albiflora TaxID=240163 RepID=A0ACB7F1X4_NIBAL|nr:Olfactory receptor 52K1 [Nibea albiflora]
MENYTYNSLTLQLEGLRITKTNKYPIFIFLLLSYVFILIANVGIVILIWKERSLHQPMYLLFCNLSINDVMGNSLLVPRVLADILVPPSDRLIHYYECVMQAFTTHMFSTNAHTVLMIMAFDRYVAICNPLRYSIIMNDKMVIKLTVSAWGVAFVLVGILLGLTIRLNRCRTLITNPYCDNASLFKLSYILVPPSDRLIHYYECLMQAFTTHMFGTNAHTVLMIMAFDRYVAICNPLHYSTIMNDKMVMKLTVSAWGVSFVLVAILLSFTIRLNRCRTLITNPYCDNPSLFKLSCENVFINNVYGLTFTVVLLSSSIGSILLTYFKIAAACLTNKSNSLNSKALKTCSTHLCLYLIMSLSGMILISLHRFPQYAEYRKISAILFNVVPSSLNPVIYGLQSKEIYRSLLNIFNPKRIMLF